MVPAFISPLIRNDARSLRRDARRDVFAPLPTLDDSFDIVRDKLGGECGNAGAAMIGEETLLEVPPSIIDAPCCLNMNDKSLAMPPPANAASFTVAFALLPFIISPPTIL